VAARLSWVEREEIAVRRAAGESRAAIARVLGRAPSTVGREIARGSMEWFGQPYRAYLAQGYADRAARRAKRARLAGGNQELRRVVLGKLRRRWSPRQISGWLRTQFPDRPEMQVSHETIYQALYLQSRGNLREELKEQKALRSGRVRRRSRVAAGAVRSSRSWIDLRISERPAEAADRAVPGHWEGDLLIGARGTSAIATLVERSTRYVMLVAFPDGRTSDHVVAGLSHAISRLPAHLRRSLTWDQGNEMRHHARFSIATDCPVYFCDPHSPWQRGTNENTNGLLRDYFPKGKTDFHRLTQADLDAVAHELNTRPRQTLNWQTPAEQLDQLLIATTG
jgi:IS30 family transposase